MSANGRRLLVATIAILGLSLLTGCSGDSAKDSTKASGARSPVWPLRELKVPTISRGSPCPVTTVSSQPTDDLAMMLGSGAARPVGIGADALLTYVPPTPQNAYAGSEWGGNKVLWAVAPEVTTRVVVRGRQLDGMSRVRFGLDRVPDSKLVLPAPTPNEPRLSGGRRDFPNSTRLLHAGCFGYQVDTPSQSTVIVFEAR